MPTPEKLTRYARALRLAKSWSRKLPIRDTNRLVLLRFHDELTALGVTSAPTCCLPGKTLLRHITEELARRERLQLAQAQGARAEIPSGPYSRALWAVCGQRGLGVYFRR